MSGMEELLKAETIPSPSSPDRVKKSHMKIQNFQSASNDLQPGKRPVTVWEMVLYHNSTIDTLRKNYDVIKEATVQLIDEIEEERQRHSSFSEDYPTEEESVKTETDSVGSEGHRTVGRNVVWMMAKWVGRSKYNVDKRARYETIREKALVTISDTGIVTCLPKDSEFPVPLSKQGRLEAYTDENLKKREALARNSNVIDAIEMWWYSLQKSTNKKKEPVITREIYMAMVYVIYAILLPSENTGHVWDVEFYRKTAEEDWLSDSAGHNSINQQRFHAAIFELADLWCETCEEYEYITFIRSLNKRIWDLSMSLGVRGTIFETGLENGNRKLKQGEIVGEDGFVYKSIFEQRLLSNYFNHSNWRKDSCDIQVKVEDLIEDNESQKQKKITSTDKKVKSDGKEAKETEQTTLSTISDVNDRGVSSEESLGTKTDGTEVTRSGSSLKTKGIVKKQKSLKKLELSMENQVETRDLASIRNEIEEERQKNIIEYQYNVIGTVVKPRGRAKTPNMTRPPVRKRSNSATSRSSSSFGGANTPGNKDSARSAKKVRSIPQDTVPEERPITHRVIVNRKEPQTHRPAKIMYTHENRENKKRLGAVQSKYYKAAVLKTGPPPGTTLEKVILNQVRATIEGSYPKSYVHLCGFIEQGIVKPEEIYGEKKSRT